MRYTDSVYIITGTTIRIDSALITRFADCRPARATSSSRRLLCPFRPPPTGRASEPAGPLPRACAPSEPPDYPSPDLSWVAAPRARRAIRLLRDALDAARLRSARRDAPRECALRSARDRARCGRGVAAGRQAARATEGPAPVYPSPRIIRVRPSLELSWAEAPAAGRPARGCAAGASRPPRAGRFDRESMEPIPSGSAGPVASGSASHRNQSPPRAGGAASRPTRVVHAASRRESSDVFIGINRRRVRS